MSDINFRDYTSRLSDWNAQSGVAIELLDGMKRTDDDRDLLAVDWRDSERVADAGLFIAHVGLAPTEAGLPMYDDALVKVHKTSKKKYFFDFETPYKTSVGETLHIVERRIVLPNEGTVAVASLFRASRRSLRESR
jgi:hypothetical protein